MADFQFPVGPVHVSGNKSKRKCVICRDDNVTFRRLRNLALHEADLLLRPETLLERLVRLVKGTRVRRVYVLTLVALTTITWTCLVAMLFTMGVILPLEVSGDCNDVANRSALCGATREVVVARTLSQKQDGGIFYESTEEDEGPEKLILRWTKYYGKPWRVPQGRAIFEQLKCPYRNCFISDNRSLIKESDALLVHMRDISDPSELPSYRRPDQRWVFYLLESPYHSKLNLTKFNGIFNWTSTYSYDSDIPSPYGSYEPRTLVNGGVSESGKFVKDRTFGTKTRLAAWFVTNCKSRNRREEFVNTMQNHILIDVYGICGKLKCHDRTLCLDMLKQKYRFYLAFENSNCRQYITEKFWHNALEHDIVPVVMGAPKEDYERVAPPHSFIHVDDFSSTRELSRYLRMLQKDTKLYNEYFQWKTMGTVRTHINEHPTGSQFWCHLCKALHDEDMPPKVHHRIDKWWSVPRQCRQ